MLKNAFDALKRIKKHLTMFFLFVSTYKAKYDGKHFYVKQFSEAGILHARQLINVNGNFKQHNGWA